MDTEYKIIEGYVSHIIFRNEDNGFTVFGFETAFGDWTCTGIFSFISEGQYLELTGVEHDNVTYNEIQFKVSAYQEKQPEDAVGMERYLGSGAIKGIGPNLARKIVKKFKLDTFRMIEEEPERLAEIKGISERMACSIATQFLEMKELRDAMMFLGKYQIPNHYAVKIFQEYGEELYEIVHQNPYRLAEDITGIGFRTADEIARRVGIDRDSEFRIRSGLLYTMSQAGAWGHVYLPKAELVNKAVEMLGFETDEGVLEKCISELVLDRKLVIKETDTEERVYVPYLYYGELDTAKMLIDLSSVYEETAENLRRKLSIEYDEEGVVVSVAFEAHVEELFERLEKEWDLKLDSLQSLAVWEAVHNGVTIVTGGPGTGKTTIINAIIQYLEMEGMEILLGAPTGRAAKRMKEATGYEAKTIHRLLEITGDPAGDQHFKFERNRQNPLEADVVIIDEVSMVDTQLMHSLLEAIAPGTRLVLVGDVNQLPSVGPGNVLKDLIGSGRFATVRLTRIYRQEEGSRIVSNAHLINAGEMIPLDNKSSDFFFMPRNSVEDVVQTTIELVKKKMPNYVKVDPMDVQVLVPMRKGEIGVNRLNEVLQEALNPASADKNEHEAGKIMYREGDKVMQIKNNYKLEWIKETENGHELDRGTGVFNGDMGVITHISDFAEEVTVEFDEGHKVKYPFGFLDELELAYAVTVHKSQGSEYPVVVMPLMAGPQVLFTRNLLYTAVTRAKSCVVLVGDMQAMGRMIRNNTEQKRYSGLLDAVHTMVEV